MLRAAYLGSNFTGSYKKNSVVNIIKQIKTVQEERLQVLLLLLRLLQVFLGNIFIRKRALMLKNPLTLIKC